jgi:hypothetical protein
VQLPFLAPELYSRGGIPDLLMNVFSRSHDGLALLGLADLGGPTFPRFDAQARAVMVDITLRELGGVDWRAWLRPADPARPARWGSVRRFAGSSTHCGRSHVRHEAARPVRPLRL